MTDKKTRGAVLQFEIDRKRWYGTSTSDVSRELSGESQEGRLKCLARTALNDTIRNGGTFVMVVTPDKITVVQRPDAEEL